MFLLAIGAWLGDGGFIVLDYETTQEVIVAPHDYYAEASLDQLRKDRAVHLGAWSAVSGTLTSNGQPVANAEVRLFWMSKPTMLSFQVRPVLIDSNGRFAFPQVPPGNSQVSAGTRGAIGGMQTAVPRIVVAAGENKQVTLKDDGAAAQ